MATAAVCCPSSASIRRCHFHQFDSLNGRRFFFSVQTSTKCRLYILVRMEWKSVCAKSERGCIQMRHELSRVKQRTNEVDLQVLFRRQRNRSERKLNSVPIKHGLWAVHFTHWSTVVYLECRARHILLSFEAIENWMTMSCWAAATLTSFFSSSFSFCSSILCAQIL